MTTEEYKKAKMEVAEYERLQRKDVYDRAKQFLDFCKK
jgi:hypothetical protein